MRRNSTLLLGLAVATGCAGESHRDNEAQLGSAQADLVVDERSLAIVSGHITHPFPDLLNEPCWGRAAYAFAALYRNLDATSVATANTYLESLDTPTNVPDGVTFEEVPCYWAMPLLVRTYVHPTTAPRLTATARTALENMMWRFVRARSTLADAVADTWTIHMSENHDAMQKSVYLIATNALRGARGDDAKLADGGTLLAHQNAWRNYWKAYFQSRAREGIGIEIASPVYSKYSLSAYYNIYDFAGSVILKTQAEKFLTLYYADVAQDYQPTTGVRGGAETRAKKDDYSLTGDGDRSLRTWLYVYDWHDDAPPAATDPGSLFPATSAYRVPSIITEMAVNPSKPPFAYVSRRPGRQVSLTGTTTDTMMYQVGFDASDNSNLRRYTFNTSDYVLGALKLDPSVVYTDLNNQNRWMGVVFANDPSSRIVVLGRGTHGQKPDGSVPDSELSGYSEILGDAGPGVMVVARDPKARESSGTRVFVSYDLWDNRVIEGEWLFTHSGDAYAGIRIANDTYVAHSVPLGKMLDLVDQWSPVVIQLGQASQYVSFSAFRDSVKSNTYSYLAGEVTYVSENGDTYRIRRNSFVLPSVNGGGSLDPAKTYSSPYILGYHGENVVTLSYANRTPLVLDFTF
jgi:hypothetical protein